MLNETTLKTVLQGIETEGEALDALRVFLEWAEANAEASVGTRTAKADTVLADALADAFSRYAVATRQA